MSTLGIYRGALLGLLATLALSAPLRAQDVDPRWLPWVGCWEPVGEDDTGEVLCVRPAGAGVEVTEVADGAVRSSQTLVADGRAYPFEAEGCTGTRSAEFSADGHRIFTLTEQECDGDVARTSTGLIAMVSPQEWIDVQAAQAEGEGLGWAQRYRAADEQDAAGAGFADLASRDVAARRARRAASATVDVDDVVEAVRSVDPEGVRTWIAELRDPFDLDARRLLRLADAGVPASVIDVVVAVSYPDRFAIDRDGDIERLAPRPTDGPRRGYGYGRRRGFFGPVYYDPFYDYGYGYGYGYGYPYYGPGVVVVEPRPDPEPNAKVVKGRGYTRGNGGARRDTPSGPSVRAPQGGSQPSAPPSSSPSAEPSSGSSEGRKAKPREG